MGHLLLPSDILLMICQELGRREDYTTLYRFARTGKAVAWIALEQLYRNLSGKDAAINSLGSCRAGWLWRSIILSSLDATLYPYCAYIRPLSMSSLRDSLDVSDDDSQICYVSDDPQIYDSFYGSLTQDSVESRGRNWERWAFLAWCVNSVANYLKDRADANGSLGSVTELEASPIQAATLPDLIRRLTGLKHLELFQCDWGLEIGKAIAESCPNFAELTCRWCPGGTDETHLTALLQNLLPQTLQRFEVICQANLGAGTLAALSNHSSSLRTLHLPALPPDTIRSLGLLSPCTALESLHITAYPGGTGEHSMGEAAFNKVATWISSCRQLRTLNLDGIHEACRILGVVLHQPIITLHELEISFLCDPPEEVNNRAWSGLARQSELHSLIVSTFGHNIWTVPGADSALVKAIEKLPNLLVLELKVNMSVAAIVRLTTLLPRVEIFSFSCEGEDPLDDTILESLSQLRNLVSLTTLSWTTFTYDGLMRFAQRLDPVRNSGIEVNMVGQDPEELDPPEGSDGIPLATYFAKRLGGRLEVRSY